MRNAIDFSTKFTSAERIQSYIDVSIIKKFIASISF